MATTIGLQNVAKALAVNDPRPGLSPLPEAQAMSVPLTLGAPGENPGPRLGVALAGTASTAILMDSGSTGLRLLPSVMRNVPKTSYRDTGLQASKHFANDHVYYGTIGIAKPGVSIGGKIRLTVPLQFQIVTTVCDGNVPSPLPTGPPQNCKNTTPNAEHETGGGVIGVRPEYFKNLGNPLAKLPAPFDSGFVISVPSLSLTVGATAANQTGFSTVPVPTATDPADGSPYWPNDALFRWCYAVDVKGSLPVKACPNGLVLTDTGANDETVSLPIAPPTGIAPNVEQTLPPGSHSIRWTLETGACSPLNAPNFYFAAPSAMRTPTPSSAPPNTTNGLTPYFHNDVLYDLKNGYFGFRPATPMPFHNCS
jgi:hypothetical protein